MLVLRLLTDLLINTTDINCATLVIVMSIILSTDATFSCNLSGCERRAFRHVACTMRPSRLRFCILGYLIAFSADPVLSIHGLEAGTHC